MLSSLSFAEREDSLSTPTQEAGKGVWTFYGSATIDAPAQQVWDALKDFQSYSKWNSYMSRIGTPSGDNNIAVGDMITLAYRPEPKGDTMDVPCEIIEVNDEQMRLCWRGRSNRIPLSILLGEKVHRITKKGGNQCVLEVFETQSGPMAYVIKWTLGQKLSAMSEGIADGLKEHIEASPKAPS